MYGKLTQPKVSHYLHWLHRNDYFGMKGCIYDDRSNVLLDELFVLLEQVAPVSENGTKELWLRAERGPIEDYGNAQEEIDVGNFETEEPERSVAKTSGTYGRRQGPSFLKASPLGMWQNSSKRRQLRENDPRQSMADFLP